MEKKMNIKEYIEEQTINKSFDHQGFFTLNNINDCIKYAKENPSEASMVEGIIINSLLPLALSHSFPSKKENILGA